MSPESRPTRRVCSITDALAIVGDRYALLVVRELRMP
jgi:DNA-binding HxlR family transcriptional regulator